MKDIKKFYTAVPLKVNPVSDQSTKISEKTEANAFVTISIYDQYYYGKTISMTAKADGTFSTTLTRKLKKGTMIITNADNDYNDEYCLSTVKDKTPPKAPGVYPVKTTSLKITGKAEAASKVYVKRGTTLLATGKTSYAGKFSIKIKSQKANTVLTVYVKDASGNVSASKKITV